MLNGDSGNDVLAGQAGSDFLVGGEGRDIVDGGEGNDTLQSGNGSDSLSGREGLDILRGGNDDDQLFGDEGGDTLNGGTGADGFFYSDLGDSAPASGQDTIEDFNQAQGDKMDLGGVDAVGATAGVDDAFTFIGRAAFTGVAGQLRVGGTGNTIVQGDTDGDSIADFQVRLLGTITLTAGDFVL